MPKPMLSRPQQTQENNILSAVAAKKADSKVSAKEKMMVDRILRKPRSKKYMDALHKLDAGGHTHNQQEAQEIINAIREEFPEVELEGLLLGIVSECFLGKPYEVHTVDMGYQIIDHYERGRALPGQLEKARGLAIMGGYEAIEVYSDCMRAISSNGSVAEIPF